MKLSPTALKVIFAGIVVILLGAILHMQTQLFRVIVTRPIANFPAVVPVVSDTPSPTASPTATLAPFRRVVSPVPSVTK